MLSMTFNEILLLLKKADHFMATSRDIDIFVDDYDKDLRIVYRVRYDLMRVDIARLNNYDKEKHCWQDYLSRSEKEIPNKRGMKKLLEWIKELNLKYYGYPNPRMASYYLRDGKRTHVA